MTVVRGADLVFDRLPGRVSADPFPDGAGTSSLRVVEMSRTERRTAHRHPESEEVVYVESGRGSVWIDGASTPVTAGDVVRIPVGAAHATVPDEDSDMRLICFFPHPVLADNIEDTDIEVT